jgi:hypothetical protein
MAIKMMVSLVLLLILLIKLPKGSVVSFALVFVGCYMAFLGFITKRSLALLKQVGRP